MINNDLLKDDLYLAVNGEWLKTAIIPEDRAQVGGFQNLVIDIENLLLEDFKNLKNVENPEMKEFLKFFNEARNFEKRNKEGYAELKKYITKISEIKDYNDFSKILKEWTLKGFPLPFSMFIGPDMMNAKINVLHLNRASIILPDKTYYEKENGKTLINSYTKMLEKIFEELGYSENETKDLINKTIEFDKIIYPYTKTSVELADYTKSYNPRSMEKVKKYSKKINFEIFINDILNKIPEKVIIDEPNFFENLENILTENNLELLKAWLISKLVIYLSSLFTDNLRIIGGLYQREKSGIKVADSIDKYSYYTSTAMFSDVISVYYGKKYFGEKAKKDVENMVKNIINVYKKRLEENTWLKENTKKMAIKKLNSLGILIAYPEEYKDIYIKLKYNDEETFFENFIRFKQIKIIDHFKKWNTNVDKMEWGMSSNTVNAYYHPLHNHICFPAAILQEPFYSITQSKSKNYGGIGAVIGHEISHAFDNNGSNYDENGNLLNWWDEEDYIKFEEKTNEMIEQFDGIPFGSGKVNGKLTVSENIADLGGITSALEALKLEEEYSLDEYFINWARIWRRKAKPEHINLLLNIDVHSPGELRANITPQNLDDFHKIFGIKKGDGMYREKEKRIMIW